MVASISQRPDLLPLCNVLDAHGDEIFSQCDSVVVEFDMDKEILKRVFTLAARYEKQVYAVISNMSIAMKRRDLLKHVGCFVCNLQEAGLLFMEDMEHRTPEEMEQLLPVKIRQAGIRRMVVTMGADGAVYADADGASGHVPAMKVNVKDTTGAGDAFFSGVTIGLTYGKTLRDACSIGTRLAASVIATKENVCPRFRPEEFGISRMEED